MYALKLLKENETTPAVISFKGIAIAPKSTILLLAGNKKLKWKKEGETISVFLPEKLSPKHAVVLKIIL